MRRSASLLLIWSSLACLAFAEAPKAAIKGPSNVAAGCGFVLDGRESVSDRPLRWKLDGPSSAILMTQPDQDGRKGALAFVLQPPPGVYRFTLVALGIPPGGVELDADAATWTVTVGDAPTPPPDDKPKPGPPPAPTPPPTPSPARGTLNVSLVTDLDALSPDTTAIRVGQSIRPALSAMDAWYRTYPVTSPSLDRLNLRDAVTSAGTPCLIVQDATGHVLAAERAPADEAGVIARVKQLRGQP